MSMTEQFERWDRLNPKIYGLFRKFALEAMDAGYKKYSARTIIHRIRWHIEIETRGDKFKINDHWSPYYARKFDKDFPQHKGFFRQRKAEADENLH